MQNSQGLKTYCTATLDDDFAEDCVLVMLADKTTTQNNGKIASYSSDVSTDIFNEIDCADNLATNTTMTVHRNTLPLYLGLANSGKSGSAWKITITNTTDQSVTVYYNTKMCTEADAKNRTNLKDISGFTLAAGASKTVTISERFLATSIAVSFVSGGYRYVSYANSLNTSGGINVMYNKV